MHIKKYQHLATNELSPTKKASLYRKVEGACHREHETVITQIPRKIVTIPASLMKGAEMRGSVKSWEMPRREFTSGSLAVSAALKYTMRTCQARHWLVGWLVDGLVDWLVGWLVDWLGLKI